MFINYADRIMNLKLCVFGHPALETQNFVGNLYESTPLVDRVDRLISTKSPEGPIVHAMFTYSHGAYRSFKINISVASVTSDPTYDRFRSVICRGMDGLLFLLDADSNATSLNHKAWEIGLQMLHSVNREIDSIPLGLMLVGKDGDLSAIPPTDEEIETLLGIRHEDSPVRLKGRTPEIVVGTLTSEDFRPTFSVLNALADQILKSEWSSHAPIPALSPQDTGRQKRFRPSEPPAKPSNLAERKSWLLWIRSFCPIPS